MLVRTIRGKDILRQISSPGSFASRLYHMEWDNDPYLSPDQGTACPVCSTLPLHTLLVQDVNQSPETAVYCDLIDEKLLKKWAGNCSLCRLIYDLKRWWSGEDSTFDLGGIDPEESFHWKPAYTSLCGKGSQFSNGTQGPYVICADNGRSPSFPRNSLV
jgi:hypothetical protein